MTISFFDRKPAAEEPVECEPHRRLKRWIYDLREVRRALLIFLSRTASAN
jgi:hypothetical protein